MALIGWVDRCSASAVEGWASETAEPSRPVAVEVFVGPRLAGLVVADRHRPDLQSAGHGDGRKAFYCPIPSRAFGHSDRAEVRVCFAGTEEVIPNGSFVLDAPPRPAVADNNPWDAATPYDYSTSWLGAAICTAHINRIVTGDPAVHPTDHLIRTYVLARPASELRGCRALLLGASEGNLERRLCGHGFIGDVVATDIAENALARAKAKADALGYRNVRHVPHDLNEPMGGKFGGPFDFIFAEGVLHHVENVEQCLRECDRLLKPGGLLFALEFEGPFRFQLSDLQVRWINAALGVLPRGLRPFPDQEEAFSPASEEDNRRVHYVPAPEEAVAAMDPSEALTGPELKRLLPRLFDVVERKGYGGTLLSYMTGHFDFKRANTDPVSARWLRVLIEIERATIDSGILDDEFVSYVLAKRAA